MAQFEDTTGSYDPLFATGGHTVIPVPDFSEVMGWDIDQMNGTNGDRIVVVGEALSREREWQVLVARLDVGGALDPTFSGDGLLTTGFVGFEHAYGRGAALSDDPIQQIFLSARAQWGKNACAPWP